MKDGTYNRAVYWSDELSKAIDQTLRGKNRMYATYHAMDKIVILGLPEKCYYHALQGEVVEAMVKDNQIVKVVTRLSGYLDNGQDMCTVLTFNDNRSIRVKTIWVNSHTDNHATIRTNQYVRGK